MLGGVTKGPVLPTFELLKEAGFEGVELISPNQLDRDEVLAARDKTGLVIHGVSGRRHWQEPLSDPDPEVVERGLAAIRQEIARLQGLRRHDRAGRPRRRQQEGLATATPTRARRRTSAS